MLFQDFIIATLLRIRKAQTLRQMGGRFNMRKSIEDDLKAIGLGLDAGILPTVFNRGGSFGPTAPRLS